MPFLGLQLCGYLYNIGVEWATLPLSYASPTLPARLQKKTFIISAWMFSKLKVIIDLSNFIDYTHLQTFVDANFAFLGGVSSRAHFATKYCCSCLIIQVHYFRDVENVNWRQNSRKFWGKLCVQKQIQKFLQLGNTNHKSCYLAILAVSSFVII